MEKLYEAQLRARPGEPPVCDAQATLSELQEIERAEEEPDVIPVIIVLIVIGIVLMV